MLTTLRFTDLYSNFIRKNSLRLPKVSQHLSFRRRSPMRLSLRISRFRSIRLNSVRFSGPFRGTQRTLRRRLRRSSFCKLYLNNSRFHGSPSTEPQPNKSPSSQPISPTQFPPSSLCGHQPTLDPMNPITCRAAETDPTSRTDSASGETTPTDRQKVFSKDQKPCVECKTLTKEDRGADKSSTDRGIFKDGKVAEKAEDKPGGSSSADRCRSRRADALRRGTSIQETIADACKKTLQRMLSSPSTRKRRPSICYPLAAGRY